MTAPLPPAALTSADLDGVLAFLRAAEGLKTHVRSAHTSDGRAESVAAHSWRVCLFALVLAPSVPGVDLGRLLAMCVVHDLGEALGGDVPAPEQARRLAADPGAGKAEAERADLLALLAPLPPATRDTLAGLWEEYEAAATPEARLAKALDKLETLLQHVQGRNPPGFDYRFNLGYGRRYTEGPPLVAELRARLDVETERRATEEAGAGAARS